METEACDRGGFSPQGRGEAEEGGGRVGPGTHGRQEKGRSTPPVTYFL